MLWHELAIDMVPSVVIVDSNLRQGNTEHMSVHGYFNESSILCTIQNLSLRTTLILFGLVSHHSTTCIVIWTHVTTCILCIELKVCIFVGMEQFSPLTDSWH